MKSNFASRGLCVVGLALLACGCDPDPSPDPRTPAPATTGEREKPVRKVEFKKNIFLEIQGDHRRVIVSGSVCLQKGQLELLLTRKDTKEHEAVLNADLDARDLHQALILANAREGKPVSFQPKYQVASGQPIKISVIWSEKGQRKEVDARQWVRNANTKQPLKHHWVFAGSKLIANPLDPTKRIYLANDGDLVCVSNFESALMDLPIKSSKDSADLVWEANTEKIPPVGTPVSIVFEPIPEEKK